jgi:type III secretion protein T
MPYAEFHRVILAAVIAMARIGGAFAICPALTESMIPGVARRAFVLGISILAVPPIMAGMPPGEPNHFMFALVAAKEAFLGFLIGFFAAVPFWVAENVGNLIDNQRGATMGEVYSPLNGAQVSTFGIFFSQIASTLFFVGGAIFVLIGALYSSYSIWPVFTEGIAMSNEAPLVILGASDGMLCTTVIISAPVIMVMFLATLGLGFVNRTAPQLNVFFLSMPVKSALGIAFLVIYLPFVMDMLMYGAEDAILAPMKKIIAW